MLRQKRVECHAPLPFQNEVDFSDVPFFLIDISLFRCVFELARHESETDFVNEVWVEIPTDFEKQFERVHANYVRKQEFAHDVLLDFRGNVIEILLAFVENCCPIIFPKVIEMSFNPVPQLAGDVQITTEGLVFYLFYQIQPNL